MAVAVAVAEGAGAPLVSLGCTDVMMYVVVVEVVLW